VEVISPKLDTARERNPPWWQVRLDKKTRVFGCDEHLYLYVSVSELPRKGINNIT